MPDLTNLKSGPLNFGIALWDPQKNGTRYLKALLYNLCLSLTPENRERLSRIKNRHVGNPISVRHGGDDICMDYLQAAYELEFLDQHYTGAWDKVLEIGAGYGRTCHAILSNHSLESYQIVDLESCLNLSRAYLAEVLDKDSFAKVKFTLVEDFDWSADAAFDLCINIDSFEEMDTGAVRKYMEYVEGHSRFFYHKDPVGKYLDRSLDDHFQGEQIVQEALKTGVLHDVIDIHDNRAVMDKAHDFVRVYRPGSGWTCIGDSWAAPWSFYWQAMYENKDI